MTGKYPLGCGDFTEGISEPLYNREQLGFSSTIELSSEVIVSCYSQFLLFRRTWEKKREKKTKKEKKNYTLSKHVNVMDRKSLILDTKEYEIRRRKYSAALCENVVVGMYM